MTKYLNYIKDETNINKSFIIVESTNTNKKIYAFNNVKDIYNVKRTKTLEHTKENIDILIEKLNTTNVIEIIQINSFRNTFKIIETLKVCTKCKEIKEKTKFSIDRTKKNNILSYCKQCKKNIDKKNYEIPENKQKLLKKVKKYREENIIKIKKYTSKYYIKNKEQILNRTSKYSRDNRKKINENSNKRYKNDIEFKLRNILRGRLKCALNSKKSQKKGSAVSDLGCNIESFKIFIESQFDNKMNWKNHGIYWQLDHRFPLSKAKLENKEEFLLVSNYINYQPLEKTENIVKSDKILLDDTIVKDIYDKICKIRGVDRL